MDVSALAWSIDNELSNTPGLTGFHIDQQGVPQLTCPHSPSTLFPKASKKTQFCFTYVNLVCVHHVNTRFVRANSYLASLATSVKYKHFTGKSEATLISQTKRLCSSDVVGNISYAATVSSRQLCSFIM